MTVDREALRRALDSAEKYRQETITLRIADVRDLIREDDRITSALQLAEQRPDGETVVRVTQRPIPGVGIGEVTSTYVLQTALKAALGLRA